MAVTKNQLVFDLLNIVRGGLQGDDELISEEQVSFWIDNTRARLIRNDLDKKRSLNPDLIQTLGCVDVERVDASECGCVNTGCEVTRTVNKIPTSLEIAQRNLITSVGSIVTTDRRFNFVPYSRAIWANPNSFSYSIPVAFLHNQYMYIIGPGAELLEKINIQGVWESPEELKSFLTCEEEPCYTDDSPYPISRYMIEDMKKMILETNFGIAATAPSDSQGDSSHKVEPNVQT